MNEGKCLLLACPFHMAYTLLITHSNTTYYFCLQQILEKRIHTYVSFHWFTACKDLISNVETSSVILPNQNELSLKEQPDFQTPPWGLEIAYSLPHPKFWVGTWTEPQNKTRLVKMAQVSKGCSRLWRWGQTPVCDEWFEQNDIIPPHSSGLTHFNFRLWIWLYRQMSECSVKWMLRFSTPEPTGMKKQVKMFIENFDLSVGLTCIPLISLLGSVCDRVISLE